MFFRKFSFFYAEKHPAPRTLRLFAECFRQLNADWLNKALGSSKIHDLVPFSDAAIQIHAGDAIAGGLM